MNGAFDLIGDIHGCADELEALLRAMGYRETRGAWRHPRRTAVFVGDFLDRGPRIREALRLVRDMLEHGSALAVLGNHEWNHLAYAFADPDADGQFLRPHTPRNEKQVGATLGTTEKTVKVHRARVMQKMGVASLAQLVRIVDRALRESGTRTILTHASAPLSRPRALAIIESVLKREPRDSGDIPAIRVDDVPLSDAARHATEDVSVSPRTMDQGAIHD